MSMQRIPASENSVVTSAVRRSTRRLRTAAARSAGDSPSVDIALIEEPAPESVATTRDGAPESGAFPGATQFQLRSRRVEFPEPRHVAVYDAMEFIRPDLQAICYGIAMSVGSPLLAEGAQGSGWRYRTARQPPHQPASGGFDGRSSELRIAAPRCSRCASREKRRSRSGRRTRSTPSHLVRSLTGCRRHGARPLLHG